ncbi:hypothetical protein HDV03_003589 [Kappamyces sp. JEL0829]|nr:hypothetical protein HDV03_003589 [Kappamyces sp. JEL0829]
MKAVSENVGSVQMSALANLTQQAIMKGAALAIVSAIERLEPVNSPEESTMSISVQPYVFERRSSLKRINEDVAESLKKEKSKRLSIDTRFSEKLETNSALLEQMKSSYKLKQQQQAIIDSRTKSAHPDNTLTGNLFRGHRKANSTAEKIPPIDQQIPSPKGDGMGRELPKIRGYNDSSQPPSAIPAGSGQKSSPPSSIPPVSSNVAANKAVFLTACEQMFDAQESTNRLQLQLKEQIRKSATLLYTLSSSGQMIEGLVRSHFREMQSQYGEKFGSALTDLNRRLVTVEQKVFGKSQSEAFTASGALKSSVPREDGQGTFQSIANRLDAIERASHHQTKSG